MSCVKEQPLGDETQQQIGIIENSQALIRSILLGIGLQYKSLDIQKCQLIESAQNPQCADTADCPDPKALQIAASLIILSALFGFQKQAEDIACRTAEAGDCPDWTEAKLNATVIAVALIRLCRLTNQPQARPSAAEQSVEEVEETELLAEPVV